MNLNDDLNYYSRKPIPFTKYFLCATLGLFFLNMLIWLLFTQAELACFFCVIIHGTVFVALLTNFAAETWKNNLRLARNPCLLAIAMLIVYYGMSTLVYLAENWAYPEYNLSLLQQFLGQLCVAGILFLMLKIAFRFAKTASTKASPFDFISPAFCWILICFICITEWILYAKGYRNVYDSEGMNVHNFNNYFDVTLIYAKEIAWNLIVFCTTILLTRRGKSALAFLLTFIYIGVFYYITKGRLNALGMGIVFLFAWQENENRKGILAFFFAVLMIAAFSPIVSQAFLILGGRRNELSMSIAIEEATYRTNIADFFTAIFVNFSSGDPSIFYGGFKECLPNLLFPDKQTYNIEYQDFLEENEFLSPDYPDTVFSTGVAAFGKIGVFFPFFYAVVLSAFGSFCQKFYKKRWAAYLLLISLPLVKYIELGPSEIFFSIRQYITFVIFFSPMLFFFSKTGKKFTKTSAGPFLR